MLLIYKPQDYPQGSVRSLRIIPGDPFTNLRS